MADILIASRAYHETPPVFMMGGVLNAAEKKGSKAGVARKAEPEKWVAKINDKYITLEEFDKRWNAIPFQYKYQYGSDDCAAIVDADSD